MPIPIRMLLALLVSLTASAAWAQSPASQPNPPSGFIWTANPATSGKAPLVSLPADEKTAVTLQLPDDPNAQLFFRYTFGLSGNSPLLFVTDSFTFKDGLAELRFHHLPPDPAAPAPTSFYSQGFPLARPAPGNYTLRIIDSGKVILTCHWTITEKSKP